MYEDYMQNLLGGNFYPFENTYEQNSRNCGYCNNMDEYYNMPTPNYYVRNNFIPNTSINLEDLYPELYKIVYPMIRKACSQINRTVDEDLIEEITKDIYSNLEAGNIINVNISVDDNSIGNRNIANTSIKKEQKSVENRCSEDRQFNPIHDLIRILLIRELVEGHRTHFPGHGPRPPMPPHPPMHGPRPPMSPHRPRF